MIIILPLKILIHVQVQFMFPIRKNSVLSVMCNCKISFVAAKLILHLQIMSYCKTYPMYVRTLHTCTKQINYSKVLRSRTSQLFAQKIRLVSDCSLQKYNLSLTLSNENFGLICLTRFCSKHNNNNNNNKSLFKSLSYKYFLSIGNEINEGNYITNR